MKVIVKFNYKNHGDVSWIRDILDLQKKQGYITVIKRNNCQYEINEPDIINYKLLPEWIERIIEE